MTGSTTPRRALARTVVVVVAAALSLPLLPAYAAVGVRTTRAIEIGPSAGQGVLAWTQAPRSNPSAFRAMARVGQGSPFRLSARGRRGFTAGGAVEEGGNRVAYWQHRGDQGNIRILTVAGRTRRSIDLVNTAGHEWGASLSGKWLLFARGRHGGSMAVFVANLEARTVRRLARVSSGGYLQPGDVSGRWATWTRCGGFRSCRVVRHNLRTGGQQVLANPRDRSQFASSVLRNGTVFYGESGNYATCSTRLRIYRSPLGGGGSRVATLPSGTSISVTSVKRVSPSAADVYYDQSRCDSGAANVYRTRAAD